MMRVIQMKTGGDRNFAYVIISDAGEAAVIDPSYDPDGVYLRVLECGAEIRYVLNTHRHHDHTNGNERIESLSGVKAAAYGDRIGDIILDDMAVLPFGDEEIKVLHSPGHTVDSVCFLMNGFVFTGDTLFVGKVGGTTSREDARKQYDSFQNKLKNLPLDTIVYPGHDVGVRKKSTIAEELKANPFWLQPDFEHFYLLKQNWTEYKIIHGIR